MKIEDLHNKIEKYYSNNVGAEWSRLARGYRAERVVEFNTTMFFLKKYLPKKGVILDAGSGPGRYSMELARLGYDVVVLDAAKGNVEFAKRVLKRRGLAGRLRGAYVGRIEDMRFLNSNSFDAVICLGGPISHIMTQGLRSKAAGELVRVAKRGAPVFVSVIGRLASVRAVPLFFQNEMEVSYFRNYVEKGNYFGGYGFTAFHGFRSAELRALFEKRVSIVTMVALEGLTSHGDFMLKRLLKNKRRWNILIEQHAKLWTEPAVVELSEHIMLIGRKRL